MLPSPEPDHLEHVAVRKFFHAEGHRKDVAVHLFSIAGISGPALAHTGRQILGRYPSGRQEHCLDMNPKESGQGQNRPSFSASCSVSERL